MGLVISLRRGEDFFIADERYVVSEIVGTTLRLERPRDGAAFQITNDAMREVEPQVLIQIGDRLTTKAAQVVINAPRSKTILIGPKYRMSRKT
ncbi:MAG: hypothetical protein U1E60_00300 [Reyranellaceae bacterium]